MKKIYLLVLKAFVRPFIVTFFIVMLVLLMLFLFKYIDDLIGKGFDVSVILQLFVYAAATNVSMALPLAILLSSIMTFGSLGENYELVAIKSAGISLQRAMMPLIIVVSMLSIGAFYYSDYMLPIINLKYNSLLYDVRNHKAAFLIETGIFNNNLSGYSIRVKRKGADNQSLYDIMIYDRTTNDNMNVLLAKEGKMVKAADKRYLVLKLKDGIRYEESQGDAGVYNPRERLMRFRFKETEQKFDLSEFDLQRTDEELFKSHDAMLNLKQLRYFRDSLQKQVDSNINSMYQSLKTHYLPFFEKKQEEKVKNYPLDKNENILSTLPEKNSLRVIQYAQGRVSIIRDEIALKQTFNRDYISHLKGYIVELHKKYTLSISCLVLFFVGAPLGAIIRKGGLGLPVVVAIFCFLVYHIISTVGEKSVRDGSLAPVIGMWIAIFTLSPVGAFITYKAAQDSVLFDLDNYKHLFRRIFYRKK